MLVDSMRPWGVSRVDGVVTKKEATPPAAAFSGRSAAPTHVTLPARSKRIERMSRGPRILGDRDGHEGPVYWEVVTNPNFETSYLKCAFFLPRVETVILAIFISAIFFSRSVPRRLAHPAEC